MKKVIFFIILSVLLLPNFLLAVADTLNYEAPEFMQSFYDQYSFNYLDVKALGRGHTGAAATGGVESAIINPAAFRARETKTYLEIMIKPPTSEMREKHENKYVGNKLAEDSKQDYESYSWVGILGFGLPVVKNLSMGLSYAQVQGLVLNHYTKKIKGGSYLKRKPAFANYQLTYTTNFFYENVSFGVNGILNIYKQEDYRKYYSLSLISKNEYVFRVQPGFQYRYDFITVGASYIPKVKHTFDMDESEKYDVTIPSKLIAGMKLKYKKTNFYYDFEKEDCSQMSNYFDDRIKHKFGIEHRINRFTFRIGGIVSPEVFSGYYHHPKPPANPQAQNPYISYWHHDEIISNEQKWFTLGTSYKYDAVELNFGYAGVIGGNIKSSQVFFSFEFSLSRLAKSLKKGKDKPKTEKPKEEDLFY